MKSLLVMLFIVLAALVTPAHAQMPAAEKLDLSGFNPLQPVQLYLTDEQNRWLRQKKPYAWRSSRRIFRRWCSTRCRVAIGG